MSLRSKPLAQLRDGHQLDLLQGGDGLDTASYADATAGITVDVGRTLAQTGAGDVLGDVFVSVENVLGSAHDDLIVSGSSANGIDGGAGVDTVSYANSLFGVNVDLAVATNQISPGDAAGDILTRIENLSGSAAGDSSRRSSRRPWR
jgi:hypothetical protein